jgi:hypothetical protein
MLYFNILILTGHPNLGPCAKAALALDVIIFNLFKCIDAVLDALSGLVSKDSSFLFDLSLNIDITT